MSLREKYFKEVLPKVKEKLEIKNVMQIPKIEKVVLNMWIWTYIRSWNKDYSDLKNHLNLIAWQACTVRYAKKAISNFKLRAWMPVGLSVTLRWDRMYAFLDKLINIVLPRIRDFRWVNKKWFDQRLKLQFLNQRAYRFLEVPQTDVVKTHWLQITVKQLLKIKNLEKILLRRN